MMARPGKRAIHQATTMKPRPSATICPHEGSGGGTPRPRKLRVASSRITDPTCRVANTMMVLKTLGRMWRDMIRAGEEPMERANTTKSRSLTLSTSPRIWRA